MAVISLSLHFQMELLRAPHTSDATKNVMTGINSKGDEKCYESKCFWQSLNSTVNQSDSTVWPLVWLSTEVLANL